MIEIRELNLYFDDTSGVELAAKLDSISAQLTAFGDSIMASIQALTTSLTDLSTAIPAYIQSRDAIDVDLRAQIATLVAGDTATAAAIDAAFAQSEADKALLTPPAATVPAA